MEKVCGPLPKRSAWRKAGWFEATKPPFVANTLEKLPMTMSILPSMFCAPIKPRPPGPSAAGPR